MRRRIRAALIVAVLAPVTVGATACTSVPAPAPTTVATVPAPPSPTATPTPGPPGPGAAGIGDPNYPTAGNGGYDVGHYALALRYDPATRTLRGTATITAKATANLTRFDLDLHGLTVNAVSVDGAVAKQTRAKDELVITPAATVRFGATFTTKVSYGGVPSPYHDDQLGDTGFLAMGGGAIAIGEPEVAASWFPVNDHPRDKATYTIAMTAPAALQVISNGVLTGSATRAGLTTWTWDEREPMASYLAMVVIGHYRVASSTHAGLPMVTAVDSSLPTSVDALLGRSGEVIDYLATQFGPYPFDAVGGVAIADENIRFALENQTRPIYGPGFFTGGPGTGIGVVVHELAHQWYGDDVSVYDWRDIWLNEGFATYAEWLWNGDHGGATPQQAFDTYYQEQDNPFWAEPPGNPPADDLFTERTNSVYARGAMTLQSLRMTVGDAAFFQILRQWAATRAGGTGTTADFIALAQRVSGKDLTALFQQWLYQPSRPPRPSR